MGISISCARPIHPPTVGHMRRLAAVCGDCSRLARPVSAIARLAGRQLLIYLLYPEFEQYRVRERCPASLLRLIPRSIWSAARIRNPSFEMSVPNGTEIALSRSCKETSGISPSTYRTFRWRGADQRRSGAPLATASPIERASQLLPSCRGAYSIARLRSGKIGASSISLAGISRLRKSLIPTACNGGRAYSISARAAMVSRAGRIRLRRHGRIPRR
jgi:hypothetical protein